MAFYEVHLPFKKLLTSKEKDRSRSFGGCNKIHSPEVQAVLASDKEWSHGCPWASCLVGDRFYLPATDIFCILKTACPCPDLLSFYRTVSRTWQGCKKKKNSSTEARLGYTETKVSLNKSDL